MLESNVVVLQCRHIAHAIYCWGAVKQRSENKWLTTASCLRRSSRFGSVTGEIKTGRASVAPTTRHQQASAVRLPVTEGLAYGRRFLPEAENRIHSAVLRHRCGSIRRAKEKD